MTINEAIDAINAIGKKARKNSLGAIEMLCHHMGDPQDNLRIVHVAGTNGKGSVVSMIAHVLQRAGYRVGRFTSPYIESFNERIAINEQPISDDQLIYYTEKLLPLVKNLQQEGNEPSWFAFLTALAFGYFYDERCDIIVLETGIGGLYDSTNVIQHPDLTIITQIGMDHTKELGTTLSEIITQKCGIIKNGVPLVAECQSEEVLRQIKISCEKKAAPFFVSDSPAEPFSDKTGSTFSLNGQSYSVCLAGEYQINNACTAIKGLQVLRERGFSLSEDKICEGLADVRWTGRFQLIQDNPPILIDGAHNLSGMTAFCDSIDNLYPEYRKIAVVGMVGDKDYVGCLERLSRSVEQMIAVPLSNPRSLSGEQIVSQAQKVCRKVTAADSVVEGLRIAQGLCGDDTYMVCACGSLFLVSEALEACREKQLAK